LPLKVKKIRIDKKNSKKRLFHTYLLKKNISVLDMIVKTNLNTSLIYETERKGYPYVLALKKYFLLSCGDMDLKF
jgi:hypothetical protein